MPVETTARELLYKLFLAHRFAQKGFTVYLGAKEEVHWLFSHLSNFVYFDKGYHEGVSEGLYISVKKRNGVIINLDEEGGVDYNDMSTIAKRYSGQLFQFADLICFWGSRQYDFIKSLNNGFGISRSIVSGHPRFELLKPEYQYIYRTEVERYTKKYGRYILINTNMGFGNNIRGDDFVRKNYGPRIANIEEVITYDKQKLDAYLSLVVRMAASTEKNIIVRPHPEENHEPYINAFSGLPNVKVVFEGSVVPWIIGADLMVHPDCTTGIEAAFIGKTPVSYLPPTDKKVITEMPLKTSCICSDEEECLKYVSNVKNVVSKNENDLLLSFFSYDKSTVELIISETEKLTATLQNSSVTIVNKVGLLTFLYRKIWKMLGILRNRARTIDPLMAKKRGGLDYANVKRVSGMISIREDEKGKTVIHQLTGGLFCIRLKGLNRE